MIRPGEEWGGPVTGPPGLTVDGNDRALARALWHADPGTVVRWKPAAGSDLARAVALDSAADPTRELPCDLLRVGDEDLAVNACIVGTPPDRLRFTTPSTELTITVDGRPWWAGRATTVVIASGEFVRGNDIIPRGHPGDGRAEVQVYELARRQRAEMRRRLASGSHVPHPGIAQRSGRRIEVAATTDLTVELDGEVGPVRRRSIAVWVQPAAFRLLV